MAGSVLFVAVLALGACSDDKDVRETAPCGRAVMVLAEADADATEDEVAERLAESSMNKDELADTCAAMLSDLCERSTSESFDKPLESCRG